MEERTRRRGDEEARDEETRGRRRADEDERTRGRGRETMETGDELMRDDEGVRRESSGVE